MKRGFLISVGAYLGLWLLLEALFPAPSYAYLDPGTGNVLYVVGAGWRREA